MRQSAWLRKWKRQVLLLWPLDAPTALEVRPWRVMQAGERWIEKFARSGLSAGAVELARARMRLE